MEHNKPTVKHSFNNSERKYFYLPKDDIENKEKTYTKKDNKYYSFKKSYDESRVPTLEERIEKLNSKVQRFGICKIAKRKLKSDEIDKYIELADNKGITLIEEDDNILVFGRLTKEQLFKEEN